MGKQITISVRGDVDAAADVVYAVFADYRQGHRLIVSPKFFRDWHVEQGGYGAGTILTYTAMALGQKTPHRAVVSEPQPGRVLVETEETLCTTFTVDAVGADRAKVDITTITTTAKGMRGVVERLIMPWVLRPLYREEIRHLELYAQGKKDEALKNTTATTE